MISRRTLALASLIALMAVWGSTFAVTKAAVQGFPPFTLAALRFLIAAAVLVPIAWRRGGLKRLPRPLPLGALTGMGLSGIAFFTIGFNYALLWGSAAQGALIYALVPAAVAAAAIFVLKESPGLRRIAGIALSVAGVGMVVAAGQPAASAPAPLLGAASMVAAVIAWAAYTVLAKRLARFDQVVVIAAMTVIGALVLLPLAVLERAGEPWAWPSAAAWLSALFLGIVASAAAYLVYGYVLRELDASLVAAYTNLDPIVGVVIAVAFLGETLAGWQWLGGAIALGGMWLASLEKGVEGRHAPS